MDRVQALLAERPLEHADVAPPRDLGLRPGETAKVQDLLEGVVDILAEGRHGRLHLGGFLLRLLSGNLILGVDALRHQRLERRHLGKDG